MPRGSAPHNGIDRRRLEDPNETNGHHLHAFDRRVSNRQYCASVWRLYEARSRHHRPLRRKLEEPQPC